MPYLIQKANPHEPPKSTAINSALLYLPALLMILNNVFFNADNFVGKGVLICSFLIAIVSIARNRRLTKNSWLAFWGIALALISTLVNGSGLGSWVTYANLLLFIVLYSEVQITANQKKHFLTLLIFSLVVVVIVFWERNEVNTYYYSFVPELTAERLNPNMMGIICFFLYFFSLTKCREMRQKKLRIFCGLLLFFVCFILIFRTNARTTLAAFLLLNALLLFERKMVFLLRKRWFFGFLLIFSIAITVLYLYLFELIGSTTIFNKDLFSGRQVVWKEAWDVITKNLIWGYSNKFLFFNGKLTSAHNSLLSILFIFGLFPTIIAMVTMVRAYKNTLDARKDYTAIKMILCCVVIMCFETLLSDSNMYFYFAVLFLREAKTLDT